MRLPEDGYSAFDLLIGSHTPAHQVHIESISSAKQFAVDNRRIFGETRPANVGI
jgi:hypothetical protein